MTSWSGEVQVPAAAFLGRPADTEPIPGLTE